MRWQLQFLLLSMLLSSMAISGHCDASSAALSSPDGKIRLSFSLDPDGAPTWSASLHGQTLISPSKMGLDLAGQDSLTTGFRVKSIERQSHDKSYTLPVGKTHVARDHYRQLVVHLIKSGKPARLLELDFRAYNDGIAFQYRIPRQQGLKELRIRNEKSEFSFPHDKTCWALNLKNFHTAYESEFNETSVSLLQSDSLIGLPFTVQSQPGKPVVLISEAGLKNYAGMYLEPATSGSTTLISRLSPRLDREDLSVIANTPARSPWRVVLMADSPGKLIESTTILNLNDPCAIEDTSWIKPGKAAWDWWSGPVAPGKHFDVGTNNETVKYFVDFAAEMHLQYMVVDEGWYADKDSRKRKDYDYDLTKTVPEIDLPMLIKYAKQRKVGLVLWMHWVPVSKQMDRVFPYLHKLGIKGVKVDFMDHDDQQMVEFYHRVVKCAAKNHLLIDLHGAYKPTGLMRTYPNFVTQEGVMGAEYNKWSMRITPSYNLTLPFTRMAVGPMDYTPGGFRNVTVEQFEKHSTAPLVMSTRAQELAKFVVFLSPLQMVADYPGAYENEQGTEFIKAVPSNWDETRVLAGEIGKYIVVARRKGDTWYLGAMTNESPAKLSVELDFLGNGNYTLSGFKDGPNAAKNATDVLKVSMPVNSSTKLELNLAPAGGFAAALTPR